MTSQKSIEELILKTLSFYEPMTYVQILFELDAAELKKFSDFTDEDLKKLLKNLEKKKVIKKLNKGEEVSWIRVMPNRNRSIFHRLLNFFKH